MLPHSCAEVLLLKLCADALQEIIGVQPKWFEAGAKEYWLDSLSLTAVEFLLFGALELKRYQGWKETREVGHRIKVHTGMPCQMPGSC